ncbi:MAG: response regulator transcription factor [Acidobacteria bacterium]|nr:response regulator transcription factor [Acidobacteriota bacterium]
MEKTTSILLIDDHQIMRDGLKAILSHGAEFSVVGEVENGADAVRVVRKTRPDIVVMDIGLPGLNGIEATAEVLRHCPQTRVVILSMYGDDESVMGAIRSGARAFVLKKASHIDLIDALRAVAKGGSYWGSQVSDQLLNRIQRGDISARANNAVVDELSPRERQVLRLVAQGNTSKDIAAALNLSVQTVRSYRKAMMKKLGVGNVAGLTQLAIAAGLARPLEVTVREAGV